MGSAIEKQAEKPRYEFIDVLRIAACFLVIVNHTATFVFLDVTPSVTWFGALTYFFISKISVPIFVMISGYTMLDKQDDYKKTMQRVVRTVLALLVFSLGYYLFQWIIGDRPEIGVFDYFSSVLQNPLTIAYWYMYMYIGLLIMMPFLQKFVSALNKRDCEIFIAITLFVCGTWPIVEHWCPALTYSRLIDLALFNSYISMMLIAYYIKKYVTPSKKLLRYSIVGFVVCIIFNIFMTYHEYQVTGGSEYLFYDDRVFMPIVVESACVFYMATQLSLKGRIAKVLKVIGGCTFGIYLISDFVIGISQSIYYGFCGVGVHPIISVIIYEVIVFMVGFVITFVMKKIPILKKIL